MIVRAATDDDIPSIVEMSRKFYATTAYAKWAPMSDAAVANTAHMLIHDGVMLLAEDDGRTVGMVGLARLPFTFNPAMRIAAEVVWYVTPDAQGAGAGKALLAAIEPACTKLGVDAIQMMTLATSPPQAAALYERMGFEHSESSFTKVIE